MKYFQSYWGIRRHPRSEGPYFEERFHPATNAKEGCEPLPVVDLFTRFVFYIWFYHYCDERKKGICHL